MRPNNNTTNPTGRITPSSVHTGAMSISGNAANCLIACNVSTAQNNYTELAILTENNLLQTGIDPRGNAYMHAASKTFTISASPGAPGITLHPSGNVAFGNISVSGNIAASSMTVSNLRYVNMTTTTTDTMKVANLTVTTATCDEVLTQRLTANVSSTTSATCVNLSATSATVNALNAGSLTTTTTGNITCTNGLIIGSLKGIRVDGGQFRLTCGTMDGITLNDPNSCNNFIQGHYGIGIKSSFPAAPNGADSTNPVTACFNTRDGSFGSMGYLASVGGTNIGRQDPATSGSLKVWGNGTFICHDTLDGKSMFINRRANPAAVGGWQFQARGGDGTISPTGNVVVIEQSGNISAAGTLQFSATANAGPHLKNGQITMHLTDNFSLKVHARGSDGVLRSATLALS